MASKIAFQQTAEDLKCYSKYFDIQVLQIVHQGKVEKLFSFFKPN